MKTDPVQYELSPKSGHLNSDGNVIFNFTLPTKESRGHFTVAGMEITLTPYPLNPDFAISLTMAALRLLRNIACSLNGIDGLNGEERFALPSTSIYCTFSLCKGKGHVIHAEKLPDGVRVELPHRDQWNQAGLGWLNAKHDCCEQNQLNLIPWMGKNCSCGYS